MDRCLLFVIFHNYSVALQQPHSYPHSQPRPQSQPTLLQFALATHYCTPVLPFAFDDASDDALEVL